MSICVEDAGFSCIQDLGRRGFAASGVPRGGAYDEWALRAANRLTGNPDGAAAIEFAMRGPTLTFEQDCAVALAGAPCDRSLDGAEVPYGATFTARAGQTLALGRVHAGARGYVAVAGGIDSPVVLGGRGASPRAGLGRMLAAGDRLAAGKAPRDAPARTMAHPPEALGDAVVRVVLGPQAERFTAEAIDALTEQAFVVSTEADRVGMRLDGARLAHVGSAEIEPEGLVAGCIQVPGDGRPIVLGPDGPVTGGYAKIAVVCSADVCVVAQARPGATLRFEEVGVDQARGARAEREHALAAAIIDA